MRHPSHTLSPFSELLALALALSLTGGCAPLGVESTGQDQDDADAEACEHLSSGPFAHHLAGTDRATAPDLSASHTAHRIDLIPSDDGYQGQVSIAVRDAGDQRIYLDTRADVVVRDGDGVAASAEERCQPAACSDSCAIIADRLVYELGVGTYSLQLGPTTTPTITLVSEASASHHDHGP